MPERPLGLALIGCGDIAMKRHLPAVAAEPNAELIAVCDVDRERAKHAGERFGAALVESDAETIFELDSVDAVIIATPPWITPSLSRRALEAGKDVLCEKPMAVSLPEAEDVADTVARTGRLLQVGFTYRHGVLMTALRRWIQEGRLGHPVVSRIAVFDERYQPTVHPEHYQRMLATLRRGPPCIHDGAHFADQLQMMFDSPAVQVRAVGISSRPEFPEPNHNMAWIAFDSGDMAFLEIGWLYPELPTNIVEYVGPRGLAWFDRDRRQVGIRDQDGTEYMTLEEDYFEAAFREQLSAFLAATTNRVDPVPGPAEGIASLVLTLAIQEAMRTGGTVVMNARRRGNGGPRG